MRTSRRMLIIGTLAVGITTFAGCHDGPPRTYKMRWVDPTASANVLEFNMDGPTVLGRIHKALFRSQVKGTYVLQNAGTTTEGRVIQIEEGYILTTKDGNETRWTYAEGRISLKDENGKIWKPENPPSRTSAYNTPTLKEW